MQMTWILGLAAMALPALAQDPNLSITWVGQSCFVLRADNGPTVLTDPPVASVGYALPSTPADVVTVTHNHTDHNNIAGVKGTPAVVDGRPVTTRQEVTAAGTTFTLIPGFHDNQGGTVRGPNTMIKWKQAGITIVFLGDLGQDQLTDAQIADVRNADLLFLPAGGFFTITPERAAQYISELTPRVAILMHYRTPLGGPAQLAQVPSGGTPFAPLVYKPSSVNITLSTLPATPEVWVFQPASDSVTVNGATFGAGSPVAPGSIAAIFGTFTASQTASATGYPLPRKIGDTEVLIDGNDVPLYYVSPGQINVQIPSGEAIGSTLAEVRVGGQTVGRSPTTIVPVSPGLFAAANQDFRTNSPDNPAHPGEILQVYGTGQGAVTPAVADGGAAPSTSLSTAAVSPVVFLEGRQLATQFSGLAPGLAGVWQINVVLPADAPTGPTLSLTVINGLTSNHLPVAVTKP